MPVLLLAQMAGAAGLEPTKQESRSCVLPLHHAPILSACLNLFIDPCGMAAKPWSVNYNIYFSLSYINIITYFFIKIKKDFLFQDEFFVRRSTN